MTPIDSPLPERLALGEAEREVGGLVSRAQSGDRGAFEQLYRLHVARIHALCLRLSGDRERAEELTQDSFVRAWERLGQFEGRSTFGTWLYRLTINLTIENQRSELRKRQRLVPYAEVTSDRENTSESAAYAELATTREAAAPRPDRGIDLERAIAGLPSGARLVFVLHDVEGYRHREIADLTGLAEGTTKAQLHRARRLLREALLR